MVKHLITLASSAGLCLLALTPCAWGTAIEHVVERDQLAAVLRQLDALERHADNGAALPHPIATRYHFDYLRLREDIQRIRTGVQDYLTPQRAQPRDPGPLLGEYIGEADTP